MNSRETHRIRDIESFAAGVDHLCRDEWPREEIRDGRPVLMVSSFPLNKTRPIFLCVRLLAKMLQLGILIFDKLDSIEAIALYGANNAVAKGKVDAEKVDTTGSR